MPGLIAAIDFYIERAQPFVWTKTANEILAKATKHHPTSETLHQLVPKSGRGDRVSPSFEPTLAFAQAIARRPSLGRNRARQYGREA